MMATEWDADTVLRVRALRVKAGEKYDLKARKKLAK